MSKQPIHLTCRSKRSADKNCLILPLTAGERTQLRGRRITSDGTEVILLLPRGSKLLPGEFLVGNNSKITVAVTASEEELLRVRSHSQSSLSKAAYHLGNRHVEVEICENELFLLNDLVMHKMLKGLGFSIDVVEREFFPENGAYE